MSVQFNRVSASNPCPICRKPDYCRVSADGDLASCMRVEQGAFKSKVGKDRSIAYLHRLNGQARPTSELASRHGAEIERADGATIHAVYSALLERLTLADSDRDSLRLRGLTDEAIAYAGYRSLPVRGRAKIVHEVHERFGDKMLSVPGVVSKEGTHGRYLTLLGPAGMVIPCRDSAGCIVALKIRRDDDGKGSRYVYCSSKGHGGAGPALHTYPARNAYNVRAS